MIISAYPAQQRRPDPAGDGSIRSRRRHLRHHRADRRGHLHTPASWRIGAATRHPWGLRRIARCRQPSTALRASRFVRATNHLVGGTTTTSLHQYLVGVTNYLVRGTNYLVGATNHLAGIAALPGRMVPGRGHGSFFSIVRWTPRSRTCGTARACRGSGRAPCR